MVLFRRLDRVHPSLGKPACLPRREECGAPTVPALEGVRARASKHTQRGFVRRDGLTLARTAFASSCPPFHAFTTSPMQNQRSSCECIDLSRSSPERAPLADKTRERAQQTAVGLEARLQHRDCLTGSNPLAPQPSRHTHSGSHQPTVRVGERPLRRPAPHSPAQSSSHKRARKIARYKAKIELIEQQKEECSGRVDERLERRPVGTWERWRDRATDVEVELEAGIELGRMERERKRYLELLIRVETEQAVAKRSKERGRSRQCLECITLD